MDNAQPLHGCGGARPSCGYGDRRKADTIRRSRSTATAARNLATATVDRSRAITTRRSRPGECGLELARERVSKRKRRKIVKSNVGRMHTAEENVVSGGEHAARLY